ncbi:MAG: acyl-CoA thioesterase [Frankia sp.]
MFSTEAVLEALVLEPIGEDHYRAGNLQIGHNVVFGGQLLAQSIVAGLLGQEGKTVKTLHTVFARGAQPDAPLEISVERMHAGRNLASSAVTISQGDRLCTRSVVLLSADEPDFIRHGDVSKAESSPPDSDGSDGDGSGGWQVQSMGEINDPEAVGPPELDVWTRWPGAPDDPTTNQALLAFSTEGFLIGTAMRPHPGVGQAQAHVTVTTGVLSHTITFHEPAPAGEWLLLAQHSRYAGRGRGYGQGEVFRENGDLVASFVQDSLIRPMRPGRTGQL